MAARPRAVGQAHEARTPTPVKRARRPDVEVQMLSPQLTTLQLLGILHPVVLAGLGGVGRAELVAAVSNVHRLCPRASGRRASISFSAVTGARR